MKSGARKQANRPNVGPDPEAFRNSREASQYGGLRGISARVSTLFHSESRRALLASLFVFSVYWVTLPPTVTGEDSGELIAAAYTLGIAHPPGYPIWCLIAHLFTYLPIGSVAWRVALMSAVFGAATVYFLSLLVARFTRNPWFPCAVAAAFGLSSEFWEQAVIAEVYTLNSFFLVVCLYLILKWADTRTDKTLLLFSFVYGLSLCNHTTMQLLGPVFVLFVLITQPRFWRHLHLYTRCVGVALIGLLPYLYLPIRSRFNPPVDWGNPEGWDAFLAHVTRQQYTFAMDENQRTLVLFSQQLWAYLKLYSWEFAPWLCFLPLLGLIPLWRMDKKASFLLGSVAVACSLGLIFILNFSLDRTSLWLNNVFWLPSYMIFALLTGVGLDWLSRKAGTTGRISSAALALMFLLSPLYLHFEKNDKSEYYWTHDFALNIFKSLESDAIYFPTADHATFPLLYFQAVEGVRPDVTLANLYGYPELSVYQSMPGADKQGPTFVPSAHQQREIEDWVIVNQSRPVYFSQYRHAPSAIPGARTEMSGLVFRVVKPEESWESPDLWKDMQWRTLNREDTRGDLTAAMVLSDYHYARGREYLAKRQPEPGLNEFALAAAAINHEPTTLNNLGSAAVELGYRDEGARYLLEALERDPNYELAHRNLARLYYQDGDFANALKQFKRLAESAPDQPDPYFDVVDCLTKLKRTDEALSLLRAMEGKFGKHPRVFREYGFVYLNELVDSQRAEYYFTQSLLLDQNQPDLQAFLGKPATTEDLKRFYPPGVDIPDEFKDRDSAEASYPKPPVPIVELPTIPGEEEGDDTAPVGPADPTLPQAPQPIPTHPQIPGLPQIPSTNAPPIVGPAGQSPVAPPVVGDGSGLATPPVPGF